MDIILLNVLLFNAQVTMGCSHIELNMAYLLGKLTRASAEALVCDYEPESLVEFKE